MTRSHRPFLLLFAVFFLTSSSLLSKAPPVATGKQQVYCAICGDYTFDAQDSQNGIYQGKRVYLCNMKELKMLESTPDKYVWAVDPVSGKKVNKLHTPYSTDRRVRVRKVKEKNRAEVWPRRFFFESAKTRDEFLKNTTKYLKEPYDV